MAKKLYEEASVQAIANAIRAKNGSTATYKVAQMADAVLAIAPLQPDVEEYPQMSTTVAAYLTAAEAAYTDANGGSVSVLDSYTGASGIKDAPLGKALTMQGGTRYQQDETTGIGGKLNNILGGESVIYNAVPGHVLRYIVKGSGGDVIDSGRVKPTGTVRMMKFIGYVKNCRDLGGWACDGGTVRYGRMYRCAAPGAAESADANIAQNANIRYHFDLRDNASLESSPFGSEVYYKRYPLSAYYSDLVDLTKSHDTINEAINRHKKIRFRKIEYNVKKERVLHHGGEKYTFSPYSLVWDGDNYYVVGYSDKYENIGSHRVDRIAEQPEILDEPAVPPKAGFSVEKYVKTTFRMYNAPRKEVELLCDNGVMDAIIDQFGPDVHTYAGDLQNFRVIEEVAVGKVFFNWIFGFEGKVRIKAPADVKEQYRQMVENAAKVL